MKDALEMVRPSPLISSYQSKTGYEPSCPVSKGFDTIISQLASIFRPFKFWLGLPKSMKLYKASPLERPLLVLVKLLSRPGLHWLQIVQSQNTFAEKSKL